MTSRRLVAATWGFIAVLISAAQCDAGRAVGDAWGVATVHPIATQAAEDVFREGGNALDAAVCAALTLGVVDNHNSGIGGGCLILVRTPDGEILAIDGRETAPAAASREMYFVDGVADTALSQTGPLAIATPGALAAYQLALDKCGSRPLARLLAPGARAAAEGFPIDRNYANSIRKYAAELLANAGPDDPRLHADHSPLRQGETLVQTDLANTYRKVAENGVDWFYRGPFASITDHWMKQHGGVMRAEDLANYQAKQREPIRSTYHGYTVVGFPPPSSGGIHIAQLLALMEPYDLRAISQKSPADGVHLVAEGMKLVFADRAYWLGDADFAEVPKGLIDPKYLEGLAAKISPDHATPVPRHGTPSGWSGDLFGRHTTHIAAADAKGYWVAITATVNTSFGSKVVIPGTGVVMNNEMDDFSIQPGVPNAFGLVGAANNAVEPGKRPLSSMTPTIVLNDAGAPVLTVGAAGGPKIITQVALAVLRTLGKGEPLEQAIASPRFHHQWLPDELGLEAGTPPEIRRALEAKGHKTYTLPTAGVTQAIGLDAQGRFIAVNDPRAAGKAAAQ
ncbi:Gamma-glutamyltranspeptidase precursor [Pirellulimonas nuda]|uniref:Glutathione hydrolase proenzyme n=1 Tax=Pirellulimonas nuda TaxID=2528009 RepID=A0A518DAM8_9BACT|nr:gamma-glutamyltransferase [Pirellulimonas nuda]QDU88503.1 Gamma-glutamyltranspeptidase precursor [Pirellulimonas nuda]